MSDEEDMSIVLSESESEESGQSGVESGEESPVEEKIVRRGSVPSRVTKKNLGVIEKDVLSPPKAKRKNAQRAPTTTEAYEAKCRNLAKARERRSELARQRKLEALKTQISKYEEREEEPSSESEEEIVLSSRPKAKILPTKKAEREAKEGGEVIIRKPKKPEKKITLDHQKTIERREKRRERDQRLALLEKTVLDQSLEKKKDRSRKTIINIVPPSAKREESEKMSISQTKKVFLDLGI